MAPWTERQVEYLFSKGSPLSKEEKAKMEKELHEDPTLGHFRRGSPGLKKKKFGGKPFGGD